MTTIFQQHRQLWSRKNFLLPVGAGLMIFIAGVASMLAARTYLHQTEMLTASSPDFFLDLLPVMRLENFLVWGVPLLIGSILFILFLYPSRLPFSLKAVGLFLLIRSFFIILTPLGIRPDQIVASANGIFQNLAYSSNDFFFSGHVSFPFLFALIFWKVAWVRNMMLAATGCFGVGVLLAHTHYSIDVFAVPFMVPSIHRLTVTLFPEKAIALLHRSVSLPTIASSPSFRTSPHGALFSYNNHKRIPEESGSLSMDAFARSLAR